MVLSKHRIAWFLDFVHHQGCGYVTIHNSVPQVVAAPLYTTQCFSNNTMWKQDACLSSGESVVRHLLIDI